MGSIDARAISETNETFGSFLAKGLRKGEAEKTR